MAERYQRKHLSNLDELDKEQEKIRRSYKRMEHDWLSGILNPQQVALSLAGSLLSRTGKSKKKNTKDRTAETVLDTFLDAEKSPSSIISAARNIITNPLIKGFLKNTATSWLRWQAFNLAVYLGKKAYKSIKYKRAEKKLKQELADLSNRAFRK